MAIIDLLSSSFAVACFNKKSTITKLQQVMLIKHSARSEMLFSSFFEKYIINMSVLFSIYRFSEYWTSVTST